MAKYNSDGVLVLNGEKEDIHVNDILEQVIATRSIEEASECDPVTVDSSNNPQRTNLSVELKSILSGSLKKPVKEDIDLSMIRSIMTDTLAHTSYKEFGKMLRGNILVDGLLESLLILGSASDTDMRIFNPILSDKDLRDKIKKAVINHYDCLCGIDDSEETEEVEQITDIEKELEEAMKNNTDNTNVKVEITEKEEQLTSLTYDMVTGLSLKELKLACNEKEIGDLLLVKNIIESLELTKEEFMLYAPALKEEQPDKLIALLAKRYNVSTKEITNTIDSMEDRLVSLGLSNSAEMFVEGFKQLHEIYSKRTSKGEESKESKAPQQHNESDKQKQSATNGKVKVFNYADIVAKYRHIGLLHQIRNNGYIYMDAEQVIQREAI